MKTFLKLTERLFLDEFFMISLGAAALGMATLAQLQVPVSWDPVYLLLFSGTLVSYNWHRVLGMTQSGKLQLKAKPFRYIVLVFALLLMFVSIIFIKKATLLVLIPLAVVTLLYSLPLELPLWYFPLRKIPYLKVFLVAATWSVLTVWLPLAERMNMHNPLQISLIFMERFFLLFPLCLLFDIRDIRRDRELGMKTLPVALSVKTSLWLSVLSAFIFWTMVVAQSFITMHFYPAILAGLIFILFTGSLLCAKCKTHRNYYVLFVDGLLLLYGGLMVLGMWPDISLN